jgi:hypothetical protein
LVVLSEGGLEGMELVVMVIDALSEVPRGVLRGRQTLLGGEADGKKCGQRENDSSAEEPTEVSGKV